MKLLLDENLPHRLRPLITGHDCFTVAYMGWLGKQNGELLSSAAEEGFDALITSDTNLPYQQNTTDLPLAIVVLRADTNRFEDIRQLAPALLRSLESLQEGSVTIIGD